MGHKRTESLLNRVNAELGEHRERAAVLSKRILKAPKRDSANILMREREALDRETEILKIQQKALKRGIVPEELAGEGE
jgi:hypothetical protein